MNKIKLTANILFSGIGCQERGFQNSNLFDLEVLNTSEINKEAVLTYAAIHCGLNENLINTYTDYPTRKEMAQHLTDINFGYDPEKDKYVDWLKIAKKKNKDIEKYWLACKLSNNLGDISKIQELPYADLWTCSFPCTNISRAGKMRGLKPDSGTSSSLLWENMKLLAKAKENNTLPKYIMFENVSNLVSERFINDFNDLISILDKDLGYNTYWKILNAKDCKIPQNRERVFVFCIRKNIDNKEFSFPKPIQSNITINDILDDYFDSKYWLSDQIQERLQITDPTFSKNIIGTTKPEFRKIGQRDVVYNKNSIMGTLLATDYKQPKQILEDNGKVRKITPNECFKLMGLTSEDCEKARELGLADMNLYKQAGNGIVTNCCELIAEHLYKAQYNSTFICTDNMIDVINTM